MSEFTIHDDLYEKLPKKRNERRLLKFWQARMENVARSMFKWKISEPNITGDLIERYLWLNGSCIIWKHDVLGWIVTKGDPIGFNVNNIPVAWKPIMDKPIEGIEFPERITNNDECFPIYEWSAHWVLRREARFLAEDIADVTETIRTQAFNQKTPLLAITADGTKKQSIQNMIVNVGENMNVLFMNRDIGAEVKALDFNAPFNVADLSSYKMSIYNDFLAFIGCDSQDAYQKKERKIVSEQEANNEELNYILADQLNERLKACELAKKFGIEMSVEVQRSVRPADDMLDGDPEQPDDNVVI